MYDVAVAALAIGAPQKWVDNLLSHHHVPNVVTARRGVARRIPHSALVHLALVRDLHVDLGLSVCGALRLAAQLLATDGDPTRVSRHVHVTVDRIALERALTARLAAALESAPAPRRGRPRGRPTSR